MPVAGYAGTVAREEQDPARHGSAARPLLICADFELSRVINTQSLARFQKLARERSEGMKISARNVSKERIVEVTRAQLRRARED